MSKGTKVSVQVHPCQSDADELGFGDGSCKSTNTRLYTFKDPGSWNGAEYAYDMSFWLCDNCHCEMINLDI